MLLIVVGVVTYLVLSGRGGPGPEAAGGLGRGPDGPPGPAPWSGGATGFGRSAPGGNTGYGRSAPGGFGALAQYGGVASWDDTTVPGPDWSPRPMSGNRRGTGVPDDWGGAPADPWGAPQPATTPNFGWGTGAGYPQEEPSRPSRGQGAPVGLPSLDGPDGAGGYGQPPTWRPQTPPGAQPPVESSWTRPAQRENQGPAGSGWGQPGSGRANPPGGEYPPRNPWDSDATDGG
jgi:hypothetical protein